MQPEWLDWAKNTVRALKHGAHLIFPKAVFQIDKNKKTLTTICEIPSFNGSATQQINNQVFALIGYKVIRPKDTPTSVDAFVQKFEEIFRKGGNAFIEDAINGVAGIFNIPVEDVVDKLKKQFNGDSEPINPITLKGHPSLSIGRLWIQSNEIGLGQHVFAPMQKRENMDHTMQFIFWEDPEKPLGYMLFNDESKFLEGIWLLDKAGFTLSGLRSKADPVPTQTSFLKDHGQLVVQMDNITAKYDWDHAYRGLRHLFPKGELINPLAN